MPSVVVSCRVPLTVACFTSLLLLSLPTQAQETSGAVEPPHVGYVDGSATLERDGQAESAIANAPVLAGDLLRTTTGRVEILYPDGSVLDVDQYSALEFLSPTLFQVTSGRVLLRVAGASDPSSAARYQVDTPAASVTTEGPGEYRIAIFSDRGSETELAVIRGVATFATERASTAIYAGSRSVAFENEMPSAPQPFNSARYDAFDRWAADLRASRSYSRSAQYLPRDLRMYGSTLDRYGDWQYDTSYGYVWYPSVAVDWRPYYYGYWSALRPYGWTWIGGDIWSWPTHHYGRWGHHQGGWFWIPGRTWGPAWVSWASAPGYVSWCPLGFDGRPAVAFSAGVTNTWSAWTVVPRASFGYRSQPVIRAAVAPHRIPHDTPFIVQSAPPVAVPRSAAVQTHAISGAGGTVAVPRYHHGAVPAGSSVGATRPSRPAQGGVGEPPAAARRWNPTTPNSTVAVPRTSPPDRTGRPEFSQPLPPSSPGRIDASRPPAVTMPGNDNVGVPRFRTPSVGHPALRAAPPEGAVPRPQPPAPERQLGLSAAPAVGFRPPSQDLRAMPAVPRNYPGPPPVSIPAPHGESNAGTAYRAAPTPAAAPPHFERSVPRSVAPAPAPAPPPPPAAAAAPAQGGQSGSNASSGGRHQPHSR